MMRQFTLLLAAMATGVFAQTSEMPSATPSATPSASAAPAVHTIKVGFPAGQHAFSPENTKANLGDTIVFEMMPKNHSVVRMDPLSPCIPFEKSGHPKEQSWWSGFFPVGSMSNPGIYNITVDTTDPIWFYCSALDSCIGFQMVAAINAKNPAQDLERVKKGAKDAHFSLTPGEDFPDEQSTLNPSTTATPNNNNKDGDSHGLSGGAVAGIVIGAIGAFGIVGLLFFFVGRKKKAAELKSNAETTNVEAATSPAIISEHPPMYQDPNVDPRYSMMPPPGSPHPEAWGTMKGSHDSYAAPQQTFAGSNPNRLSELPSQSYGPVEIYTPYVQDQVAGTPHSPAEAASPGDGTHKSA